MRRRIFGPAFFVGLQRASPEAFSKNFTKVAMFCFVCVASAIKGYLDDIQAKNVGAEEAGGTQTVGRAPPLVDEDRWLIKGGGSQRVWDKMFGPSSVVDHIYRPYRLLGYTWRIRWRKQ